MTFLLLITFLPHIALLLGSVEDGPAPGPSAFILQPHFNVDGGHLPAVHSDCGLGIRRVGDSLREYLDLHADLSAGKAGLLCHHLDILGHRFLVLGEHPLHLLCLDLLQPVRKL